MKYYDGIELLDPGKGHEEAMKVNVIMPVWGKAYCEVFVTTGIPNQLTAGNLLGIAEKHEAVFKICTRREDVPVIESSGAFQELARQIRTEFIAIDDLFDNAACKYSVMTAAHSRGIASCAAHPDNVFVFPMPDHVMSEGTLARGLERLSAGYRAIVVPGPRLVKETFVGAYAGSFRVAGQVAAPAPCRELARQAFLHLHDWTLAMAWESPYFSTYPSNLLWRVGDEGLLLRCFHLHPLMVRPAKRILPQISIDGDYLHEVCPNVNDIYVVVDSDEILLFSLTDRDCNESQPTRDGLKKGQLKATARRVGRWAAVFADEHHRAFAKFCMRIHTGEIDQQWAAVEATSERRLRQVFVWCRVYDCYYRTKRFIQWIRSSLRVRTRLRNGAALLAQWRERRRSRYSAPGNNLH